MSQQQNPSPASGVIPDWTLADRLRKAREITGLNQLQFADLTGISRQSIGNYESGSTTPRRVYLGAWAMATGVPVEWLVTGFVPSPNPDDHGSGVTNQYTANVIEAQFGQKPALTDLAPTG